MSTPWSPLPAVTSTSVKPLRRSRSAQKYSNSRPSILSTQASFSATAALRDPSPGRGAGVKGAHRSKPAPAAR